LILRKRVGRRIDRGADERTARHYIPVADAKIASRQPNKESLDPLLGHWLAAGLDRPEPCEMSQGAKKSTV
jgi:hypothetical protein